MKFLSLYLALFLFVFIYSLIPKITFAANKYSFLSLTEGQVNETLQQTPPLRFVPGNFFYFSITLKENIERFFQPSNVKKAQFDISLSSKRLKEAYLLFTENDIKNSSNSLRRYKNRLDRMITQLEKARSQNQDVATLVLDIAEGLRLQENLLSALHQKRMDAKDAYSFDNNFNEAMSTFAKTVTAIDNLKPGLKDRFKSVNFDTNDQTQEESTPSASPKPIFQASPSAQPRRVIY